MKPLKTAPQRRTAAPFTKTSITHRSIIPNIVIKSKKTYRGICEICDNEQTCLYKKDPKHPVLYCNEFKVSPLVMSSYSFQDTFVTMNTKENERASRYEEVEYKGLCMNCEKRNTCTYPKPEGGVWSCEEYE